MKKILIPTDFSGIASKAYNVAAEIARRNNAEIVLFHIMESHFQQLMNLSYPFTDTTLADIAQKEDLNERSVSEHKLTELKSLSVFEGVNVETEVFELDLENVHESILKRVNAEEHSLIVMGTEGEEKEGQTVAQLVARMAVIPVVTVKPDQDVVDFSHITICTDFKNVSRRFTHQIGRLAKSFDAKISVLYVNTPKHFAETSEIITDFKRFKRMYDLQGAELSVYNAYKTENGILDYLAKSDADMLAISTHGRTGLSHYLLGSYTEDIINKATVPVYSYNLHAYNEAKVHYEGVYSAYSGGFVG